MSSYEGAREDFVTPRDWLRSKSMVRSAKPPSSRSKRKSFSIVDFSGEMVMGYVIQLLTTDALSIMSRIRSYVPDSRLTGRIKSVVFPE